MTTKPTLRDLRQISLSNLDDLKSPEQKIRYDEDVAHWKNTVGYQDYQLFLRRLNESVVGYTVPRTDPDAASEGYSEVRTHSQDLSLPDAHQSITNLLALLDTLDGWIDASPPPKPGTATPRFGNPAFRDYWGDRLTKVRAILRRCASLMYAQECDDLLDTLLGAHAPARRFLKPYLLDAFGSFRRLDYGTGHETSFGLFLCALTLLRVVHPHPPDERALVLRVFTRYLCLCWRLQDTYKLEPAGSHGVWGLDDYCFLPYLFGSGELRGTRPSLHMAANLACCQIRQRSLSTPCLTLAPRVPWRTIICTFWRSHGSTG